MHRYAPWAGIVMLALCSFTALGETPQYSSQSAESPPTVQLADGPMARSIHHQGFYGAAGILVAPPILFSTNGEARTGVLPPLPAPWVTLGFRRPNDVSWQASFLLVPLYDHNAEEPYALSTTGLDLDRISRNRSNWENWDVRWQVGLRIAGIGVFGVPFPLAIGPHAGLRFERAITDRWSVNVWGDFGLLPSIFYGIPLVDLRSELALTWRSTRRNGLSFTVGAFQETVGFGTYSFMTPGITTRIKWNY